jgi:hypothetical protein
MHKHFSIESVRDFVFNWNIRYPIDRWWREKHNISFNSSDHRVSSFIDQLFEYEEDKLFKDIISEELKKTGEDYIDDSYVPGKGNFLNKKVVDKKGLDNQFNNINLDDFNFE